MKGVFNIGYEGTSFECAKSWGCIQKRTNVGYIALEWKAGQFNSGGCSFDFFMRAKNSDRGEARTPVLF